MSRPQKIIPPVKGSFANIIASIANGRGVAKVKAKQVKNNVVEAANEKPPKLTVKR